MTAICFAAFASPRLRFLPNWDCLEDKIHIEQLELFTHIGVPDDERATPQRLTFNITLWPVRLMNDLNDEIGRAVNYATVCTETKKFV